ncbi:MAG TPA: DUF2914 domain-containing protein, partial [Patescibacteria group bacterium]|nr:DUF2914 domain-containing protein [Patescibacteria group bacterium]
LFATAAGAYFVFFRPTLEGSERAVPQSSVAAPTPAPPASPEPAPAPPRDRTPPAPPAPKPARVVALRTGNPGALSVQEFAVGRRLANGVATDGESPFGLWQVVSFSTRVLGARNGDRIVHVWLHDGRVMQSIELKLGGASWRTHSRKTLGKVGEWAVEARDGEGRVLARSTFTCVAAGT